MNIGFDPSGRSSKNMLSRLIGILAYAVVLGIALMFSVAFFAVLAIAALVLGGYFWWKTRALRRQIQEQMKNAQKARAPFRGSAENSNIIDGEATRLNDENDQ